MNRPPHRPEEDVSLMPLPDQRRKGAMRHGRGNEPGKRRRIVTIGAAIMAVAAIAIGITIFNLSSEPTGPLPVHLPPASESYLGVYTKGLPDSYGPVTAFADATGSKPDIVMYYSGWYVPFPMGFAKTVANHGAVPLVQMDPDGINIAHIASGRYDGYLSSYAEAVRAYGHPVIVSFGHEMNGNWSSWGYRHTSPLDFVAAWQHIVKVFRALDAQNVTWLWTVNIINDSRSGKVDDQPEAVVARQFVCHLGRDRRLLPQAQLAVRSVVRPDDWCGPDAHECPHPHRRNRRRADRRTAREDR